MPSSFSTVAELHTWYGESAESILHSTGAAALHLYDQVASTMEVAHTLAEKGEPHGSLVLAVRQTLGRGRHGRSWSSGEGGVWLTLLSRNADPDAAAVLSLRAGLAVRAALAPFSEGPLLMKWPNDVLSRSGKVSGILVENRWQGAGIEWSAVGVGVNIEPPPDVAHAAGLDHRPSHNEVLAAVAPNLLRAVRSTGMLTAAELMEYSDHDFMRGRRVYEPMEGTVVGISGDGGLVVSGVRGLVTVRSGTVLVAGSDNAAGH